MNVVVTDANVLIFLSRLDLMGSFAGMDFEIHTTDFIVDEYYKGRKKDKELKNIDGYIKSGRLTIHEYGYDELMEIYKQKKGLSPSDCSVFKLSSDLDAVLLTGDKTLKLFAEKSAIEVHGIIWLIDEMLEHGVIGKIEYRKKLAELKGLSRRLPVEEIDRRLK